MTTWPQFLVGFIVFCHGFIYIRIGSVLPGPVKGWNGTSRVLGDVLTGRGLIVLVRILHVAAGILMLGCGFAIALGLRWWSPLAILGGAIGLGGFVAFWDGQTRLLFHEGAIGAGVSLVLLIAAVVFPQAFAR